MAKQLKTILWAALALCIAGAGFMLTRQREVVGVDQIGVVVSPGGKIAVHQAGDRPLVLPLVERYVRLTAKPVRYELTDGKSLILADWNQKQIKIGCQVRYLVDDAAKLVASQGTEAPQAAIETLINKHLSDEIGATLKKEGASLDDVQTRVFLVANTHNSLKQLLAPLGIQVISFDLFSW